MTGEAPKKVDPAYPSGGGGLGVGHDAAIGTLGAAASFVMPLTDPVVQAILKKCVHAPLEVRRAAWFNIVGEGLRELQASTSWASIRHHNIYRSPQYEVLSDAWHRDHFEPEVHHNVRTPLEASCYIHGRG